MDRLLGSIFEKTICGMSFGTVKSIDSDFENDTLIFMETSEILSEALESQSEEAGPRKQRVQDWIKTKAHASNDMLDATTESISVSGWNVETTQTGSCCSLVRPRL